MLEVGQEVVLVGAVLLTGLVAGLYFAFSHAVMPGLAACDDRTFTEAMRSVNRTILNGPFGLSFVGAPVLILLSFVLHLDGESTGVAGWTAGAFFLYVATLVITLRISVPLNNALAAAEPEQSAAARRRYEAAWVSWNHTRTWLSTAALGCLAWAAVLHGQG